MTKVFISFVHEDLKVAQTVQWYLSERLNLRTEIFLSSDHRQVLAGESWLGRVKAELSEAKVVVLMLSNRSVVRPWVNFEAGAAWLADKALIPACYGKMTKDTLPDPYSSLQALNLRQERHYLLTSVAHRLGVASPPADDRLPEAGTKRRLAQLFGGRMEYELDQFTDE